MRRERSINISSNIISSRVRTNNSERRESRERGGGKVVVVATVKGGGELFNMMLSEYH